MRIFYLAILFGFCSQLAIASTTLLPLDSKYLEGAWRFAGFSCTQNKNNLITDSSIDHMFTFHLDGTMSFVTKKEDCKFVQTGVYEVFHILSADSPPHLFYRFFGQFPAIDTIEEATFIGMQYKVTITSDEPCSAKPSTEEENRVGIILHDEYFYLSSPSLSSKDVCGQKTSYPHFASSYLIFEKQPKPFYKVKSYSFVSEQNGEIPTETTEQ